MAFLLIHPDVLPRIADECLKVAVPDLKVTDCRDDYSTEDGDGMWIRPFLEFIEGIVAKECRLRRFQFSNDDYLNESQLEEIPTLHVRAMITEFINDHYERFRADDVVLPDYVEVRSDCRHFCEDCESGWTEIQGQYDGPHPDDVEDDEDAGAPEIGEKEQIARRERNEERQHERDRRREAQEQAEGEVIDREFTCQEDCDSFIDYVDEQFREQVEIDTDALQVRLTDFLKEKSKGDFPPLHAPNNCHRCEQRQGVIT